MRLAPTERFTSRVQNYVRYRPGYPAEVLDLLTQAARLGPGRTVVDVGSGTGISAEFLLRSAANVYAVEPNRAMRAAAESMLADRPTFQSVEGTAEATTLPTGIASLITAFQAFHWFDRTRVTAEFRRIAAPGARLALVWNSREVSGGPFLEGYEALLTRFAPEYSQVGHKSLTEESLSPFFAPGTLRRYTFVNAQNLDWEAFLGRVLSSSYAPEPGHPNHEPMVQELRRLFEATQDDGSIDFCYETEVYLGDIH